MKTISVKLAVSQNTNHITLDYDDLGLTEEEYDNLSEAEKHSLIQDFVHTIPDQPYWFVDKITED
jgi:hypothetical protein